MNVSRGKTCPPFTAFCLILCLSLFCLSFTTLPTFYLHFPLHFFYVFVISCDSRNSGALLYRFFPCDREKSRSITWCDTLSFPAERSLIVVLRSTLRSLTSFLCLFFLFSPRNPRDVLMCISSSHSLPVSSWTVPPKWVIEPQDASVLRGRTALIDCQADGFPPPSVHWSKTEGTKQ